MKLITLTSDFGVQSQGVGIMEALIFSIAPEVKVIHLMHGLSSYDLLAAARTMETIRYIPTGFHICICDPGVGTLRKSIALQVNRGDYLIGPDNGVLLPAARILGGIRYVHEITNENYMNLPVSPIFHGRDIFSPIAAHLAKGVNLKEFGPNIKIENLVVAPYTEATKKDNVITALVIQINKFGSLHLNILHEEWDQWGIKCNDLIGIEIKKEINLRLQVCNKFGDVEIGQNLILKDDYGRIEIAINRGSFADKYQIVTGSTVIINLIN